MIRKNIHIAAKCRKQITAGILAVLMMAGGLFQTTNVYAATSWAKVDTGTYQMVDGSNITGVVSRGIDVSHWQGTINWTKAAADDVEFVMLGTRYQGTVDPNFKENATKAAAAGVKLGAYIYSYATTEDMARDEADFILNLIKDYPISFPVAFDLESTAQSTLSKAELAVIINAFCEKVAAAGYHPMVYANDYWLANKIDTSSLKYDVWVARYELKHSYATPTMWQATSTGSINGINGNVDIDFLYRDYASVIPANLWRTVGGTTYYYQNYTMQKNTWINDGTAGYYLNADGTAAKGWTILGGKRYLLDYTTGAASTGWRYDSNNWYYFDSVGAMNSGWVNDGGAWYYMADNGVMLTGWQKVGNDYFYLKDSGSMVTGWRQIGNVWYFFDGGGYMKTGWQMINGLWYYMDASGAMKTGVLHEKGAMYYLSDSGALITSANLTIDGKEYVADASGACREYVAETDGSADAGSTGTGVSGNSAPVGTSTVGQTPGSSDTAGSAGSVDTQAPGSGNTSSSTGGASGVVVPVGPGV